MKKKPALAGAARLRATGRKAILIDFTPEEKHKLVCAAAHAGVPLKEWIQARILEAVAKGES